MNLAETKRELQGIVARHRDGVPLDATARTQIMTELTQKAGQQALFRRHRGVGSGLKNLALRLAKVD